MFNFNKEKDMEKNVINNNEVVDMNEIIRIQKEYELYIDGTPLVDCNMTVGEYWDIHGGGDDGYDWNGKAQELNLSFNDKLYYLFDISGCCVLDIKKYDEEDYEEGYIVNKENIGRIAIQGFNGWFEWYDEDYLLRDAILDYILEMEECVNDNPDWIESCQEWVEDEE